MTDPSAPSLLTGADLPPVALADLGAALDAAARINPAGGIVSITGCGAASSMPYAMLAQTARHRLSELTVKGVAADDVVLALYDDPQALLECAWACLLGGIAIAIVAMPVSFEDNAPGLKRVRDAVAALGDVVVVLAPGQARHQAALAAALDGARVRILALDPVAADRGGTRPRAVPPDRDALLLLTSGSTGLPKVVALTHGQIIARSRAAMLATPLGAADVALNWMPLDHVGGILMLHLTPLIAGCPQVQIATTHILEDPLRWLDLTSSYGATQLWAPNFAFALVTERIRRLSGTRDWDLSRVATIINGGEAVNPDTARGFLAALAPYGLSAAAMRPMWGMSETCSGSILAPRLRDDLVPGQASVGAPIPGIRLRLVDADGAVVPLGQSGTLEVQGTYVVTRYRSGGTAERAAFSADGWLSTGDEGVIVDGELVLVGRSSETIIVNGVNFHAPAMEMALELIDGVRPGYTAVCGVRMAQSNTDDVIVFFCPDPAGPDTAASIPAIRTALARQFGVRPARIVPLDDAQVPRTSIGKIQRKALAERYRAGEFADVAETRSPLLDVPLLAIEWRPVGRAAADTTACLPPIIVRGLDSAPSTRSAVDAIQSIAGDAARLDATAGPRADVHVWIVSDGDAPDRDLARVLATDGADLIRLRAGQDDVDLLVLVNRVGDGALHPLLAARLAYLRNAVLELPGLSVRIVRLASPRLGDAATLAGLLDMSADEISLDADATRATMFVPIARDTPSGDSLLRPGGRYLITGAGDVARVLARYLVERYDARVTFLARPASSPDIPAGCRLYPGDVTRAQDVRGCLAAVAGTAPPDAVFHLAGHAAECPIGRLDRATIAQVCAPKVAGIDALLTALDDAGPATPVVAFSSLLASFYSSLYGPYVAANRYLEATAERLFPRVRTIAWGAWDGLGMSRAMPDKKHALSLGFGTLPADRALAALETALTLDRPVVLVGADPAGRRVAPYVARDPRPASAFHTAGIRSNGALDDADRGDVMTVPSPFRPAGAGLADAVLRAASDILGGQAVSLDDNFFDLGGDSLGVADLHEALCGIAARDLPLAPIFRARDFTAIAAFVADQIANGDAAPAAAA